MYSVLLVEDEPIMSKGLRTILEKSGLPFNDIREANNGEEALEFINKKCPEIVITDIRMPKKDGLQLCREIQEKYPQIYTVVVSGYDDFSYAQQALRYGVKDYILKPYSKNSIIEPLSKLIVKLKEDFTHRNPPNNGVEDLSNSSENQIIENAKRYIEENLSKDISLDEIGRVAGFHPTHFSQLFKTCTGKTFVQYKSETRMKKAMELLCKHDKSVTDVTLEVGYNDITHFIRTFKKYTGMTPTEFRQKRGMS